jgi:uncharacterized membrane protein
VAIGLFQDKFKRPRIRPPRTWVDHGLDFIVLDLVLVTIGYAVWWYPSLPATVPTKFGSGGQVIATGPAETVLLLPLGGLLLAGIMRAVQRWPWISNTIVAITEENAVVQYQLVNRLLGMSSVIVGVLFLVIEHQIIESALTGTNPGQAGFVTILVLALTPWPLLIGWYLWSSVKHA